MAVLLFGPYRLDTRALELRQGTRKVALPPQPCQLLAVLASHAGQLVTREQLRDALWPKGVHVSFNLGLNSCLKQIRHALDDRAGAPCYIETLTGRGYRFLEEVRQEPEYGPAAIRLALVPFEPIGPSVEQATPVAEILTDDLLVELTRQEPAGLLLVSPGLTPVGRTDFLVSGRVRASGARVRVTARMLDTATSTLLWVRTYDTSLAESFDMPVRLARLVAADVCSTLAVRGVNRRRRLADAGADEAGAGFGNPVDDEIHRDERPALVESR